MKITGIIAEYNPFHNGHKYLIDEARKKSDAVVVAMSQEVMQRGSYSPFDKSFRAQMALEGGADLVVGLSTIASLSSAAGFANEGIRLLSALNIDQLAYGIEGYQREDFKKIIGVLNDEPPGYKKLLKHELKKGNSYPRARELALSAHLERDLGDYLSKANNILALEYRRVLNKTSIRPFEVKRIGSGYHELDTNTFYSSASGIREALENKVLNSNVVPYSLEVLKENYREFDKSTYFKSLLTKLISSSDEELLKTPGFNEDFINRIKKALRKNFTNLEDFISFLKTKNITRTRIERALNSFLLGIKKADIESFHSAPPYIRVLAANSRGREILKMTTVRLVYTLKADT